jgi:hypothetical protein
LNSGKKRREHYVPRFYLDAFGDQLFVFDKQNGNDFKSGSKNIAFGRGFYDLGPEIDLEAVIAEIEGRLRNGISELIDKSHPNNISEDGRIRVSVFVALQYVRTEEFRAGLKESYEKNSEQAQSFSQEKSARYLETPRGRFNSGNSRNVG